MNTATSPLCVRNIRVHSHNLYDEFMGVCDFENDVLTTGWGRSVGWAVYWSFGSTMQVSSVNWLEVKFWTLSTVWQPGEIHLTCIHVKTVKSTGVVVSPSLSAWLSDWPVFHGENINISVLLETVSVVNVKLCLMVELGKLGPFVTLLIELTILQCHTCHT